jgi:hypothetical protein
MENKYVFSNCILAGTNMTTQTSIDIDEDFLCQDRYNQLNGGKSWPFYKNLQNLFMYVCLKEAT